MFEKLKIVVVTIVTSIIIGYAAFYYLEPDEAKNLIPLLSEKVQSTSIEDLKISNINLNDIHNKISLPKPTLLDVHTSTSSWKLYENTDVGVTFYYPSNASSLVESDVDESNFSIVVTLLDTLATKLKRNFSVNVYGKKFCEESSDTLIQSGKYISKNYNGTIYAYRSDQSVEATAVEKTFSAYTENSKYCFVFEMNLTGESIASIDDVTDQLDLFEKMMNSVKIEEL